MNEISSQAPAGSHLPTGWRKLLALPPASVDFDQRGFRTTPAATRAVLEAAAGAFLAGFHLELATPPDRAPDLSGMPEHRRGFAAEGAAMAAALLDLVNPAGGRRLATLHLAHQEKYAYLLHVGTGWAMAKLRRRRLGRLGGEAPLLRWLAYDGMGFCQAFFASPRRIRRWYGHPARPCPASCDIRYQGLGRSLWFRECGDPAAVARRIAALPAPHHGDAWSGVALAASYAGGVQPEAYARLRELAGDQRAAAAQGAAFAAEAWRRCGHVPPAARTAVETITGVPVAEAAEWTWQARRGLDRAGADASDYRCWRTRIQRLAGAVSHH